MSISPSDFGHAVNNLRPIPPDDFADRIGMSAQRLAEIEDGHFDWEDFTMNTIENIAAGLEIPPEMLLMLASEGQDEYADLRAIAKGVILSKFSDEWSEGV